MPALAAWQWARDKRAVIVQSDLMALDAAFTATVAGNQITVLPSPSDRRMALLALIAGAAHTLRLLFYIYETDAAGAMVRDALAAAARRGVRVTLVLDSFGSADTPDSYFAEMLDAGGTLRWFGTRWTPRYLIRNHQKLVVADDARLMTGGFNIADGYFAPASDADSWQDLGVMVDGPAVVDALQWFDALHSWLSTARPRFTLLRRIVRQWRPPAGPLRWLVGGPTRRLSSWSRSLRDDLRSARQVSLVSGYFSPDSGMMRRFAGVVRRGGAVLMVLPARSDNAATVGASRLLYGYLLKRGVRIAEFERNWLHAKIFAIDDIVYVGSANLDLRSLYLNIELMLRVDDAAFAARVHAHVAAYIPHSQILTSASHAARATWLARARWSLAWLMVSLADYTVTRRLNFGLVDPDPE